MPHSHSRTHSFHGHTYAPLHHHRSGSSVATMRHAMRMTHASLGEDVPGGAKVTEYPINKVMDNPYTGYLILVVILAAIVSVLFLR